jgi:excisionase family DNA binding protein
MNAMKPIKTNRQAAGSSAKDRGGFASANEAAAYLSLSRAMITKLTRTGEMPHRRYGRSLRIPWSWLHQQVEQVEQA